MKSDTQIKQVKSQRRYNFSVDKTLACLQIHFRRDLKNNLTKTTLFINELCYSYKCWIINC